MKAFRDKIGKNNFLQDIPISKSGKLRNWRIKTFKFRIFSNRWKIINIKYNLIQGFMLSCYLIFLKRLH